MQTEQLKNRWLTVPEHAVGIIKNFQKIKRGSVIDKMRFMVEWRQIGEVLLFVGVERELLPDMVGLLKCST